MCAQWCEKFDPTPLLERIRPHAVVKNGQVSFSNPFEFPEYASIIAENAEFDPAIPDGRRQRLVMEALAAAAQANNFGSAFVCKALTQSELAYLRQPILTYYLLASMSLAYRPDLTLPRVAGCAAQFYPGQPVRFDRNPIERRIDVLFAHRPLPRQYTWLRISCRGRSPEEAGAKAAGMADTHRAIFNWFINLHRGTSWFSGRPKPVNEILPGPVSTVHTPDGKLASEEFWYEPGYVEPARPYKFDRWPAFQKTAEWLWPALNRHKYRDELLDILRRYGRALDFTNYDTSIVMLWSLLERLTATPAAKYDVLVRRASFLSEDVELSRLLLTHIRRYRNRTVHGGHSTERRDQIIHQARDYVQRLLLFHINNAPRGRSIDESVRVLDEPLSLTLLRAKQRTIDLGIRIRRGR
jgi:hypothetical protein